MPILAGIHAVVEALRAEQPLDRVHIAKGASGGRMQEVIDICRRLAIPVRFEERAALDRLAQTHSHQGVLAFTIEQEYSDLDDVTEGAQLLVVLDGVEDPHNLGAVIRTAHAAGASAVIIPERRAAGLTPVVAKSAAGALAHLPVVRVTNINRTLEELKEKGFWIYGLDERGDSPYDKTDYATPTVMVFGGEGKGLHQLVKKHCDVLVSIPMAGAIASLNISVAAGVALFEWRRRKAG